MEVERNKLNFLDITLIKKDGRVYSNWFCKPTFSGRFLNFHSQHPFLRCGSIRRGKELQKATYFRNDPHKEQQNESKQLSK